MLFIIQAYCGAHAFLCARSISVFFKHVHFFCWCSVYYLIKDMNKDLKSGALQKQLFDDEAL